MIVNYSRYTRYPVHAAGLRKPDVCDFPTPLAPRFAALPSQAVSNPLGWSAALSGEGTRAALLDLSGAV